MAKTGTEKIAQFIAETRYEHIPGEAVRIAKRAILDWVGVTIAGSNEPVTRLLFEHVQRMKVVGEAGVISKGVQTSADLAAWVNGTASHALDYDDTFANESGFNFHPTVTLLSSVLALGERMKASGRDILTAYIVGIETETRLGAAIGRITSETGWHPTPVVGTIGAVAGSANVLRLNAEQSLMALGIGSSLAGGLLQNFGTMTKPLHAGNSARNGVVAAELARSGFTGNESIMEGALGFCSMFTAGKVNGLENKEEDLGKNWRIVTPGMSTKPYPCCRSTHASIDASLHLRNVQGVDPGKIVKIVCKTSPTHTRLARFHKPKSAYEGKFSIPYCIAAALLRGKVLLEDFTEERVAAPEAQTLLSKVEFEYPQEYKDNPMALKAEVVVSLAAGTEASRKIDIPKGDASNPMTEGEISAKFRDCTHKALLPKEIEKVMGMLHNLESLSDISELMKPITSRNS
jgi:2-methylcitrate dehydratase PrpD